ncbi:MAG TPA: enoyl-CoA hydratase family protein [Burkholderiaceae bacterium]
MSSELLTERDGAVLVLTFSDPATRNTLSPQVLTAAIEMLDKAESDPDLRCVVLRGDGAHFCAGGNVNGLIERRQIGPPAQVQQLGLLHQFVEVLRAFPKPIIAAVEGAAAGAGFSIALACDLIVAAEDARFVLSYARIGLTPDAGATWHLARALPRPLAQKLIWLAEPVSARQLQAWGLVTAVTDSGRALPEALALAGRLAEMAPNALAGAKELLQNAPTATWPEQLAAERDQFVSNLFHANGDEGLKAFLEKRPPKFR